MINERIEPSLEYTRTFDYIMQITDTDLNKIKIIRELHGRYFQSITTRAMLK